MRTMYMYVFSGKSAYDDGLSNYIFLMAERRTFPRVMDGDGKEGERGYSFVEPRAVKASYC